MSPNVVEQGDEDQAADNVTDQCRPHRYRFASKDSGLRKFWL